jgi:hypothetical protein
MQLLPDGSILMACRSVIWGASFRLPIYKSTNGGVSWTYLSTIDSHENAPNGQGVYEPHFYILEDGRLAVMYANEKHSTENPAYSQIISEKISNDLGVTWGPEIFVAWDPAQTGARPGMPVWTKMLDGRYIVAYEVGGTGNYQINYKISNDGVNWLLGLGTPIPDQGGAPYVISLSSGRLCVTSNNGTFSISDNYGASWYSGVRPWGNYSWPNIRWSSLYETNAGEIAAVTSHNRVADGNNNNIAGSAGSNVQVIFGSLTGGPGTNLIVSGGTYKLTHKGTNQCLDVSQNSNQAGTNVQQWTDNGNDAQRWIITLQSDGYYKFTHKGTNQCLDVSQNSNQPGANVQQWTDNGNDAQRWKIEVMADGYFKLTHKGTGNCLDVSQNSSQPGTNVQQWTDNGNDAQRWKLELIDGPIVSGGIYKLTHKGTNQCLDVSQNSNQPGANVQQWTDNGNDAQRWIITLQSDGYYKLTHKGTGNCLDVSDNSNMPGGNVQQYSDNGTDAQRWKIEVMPDGYFKLTHKGTINCLDVSQNSSQPGTNVQQWTDIGSDAQRWKLDLMGTTGQVSIANVPPTVTIISPSNNTSYNAPASISINANASDSDGSVTQVNFYNGSTLLGSDNTSPYSYTWSNVGTGTYSITVKATDNNGATTTSSVITVSVNTTTNTNTCSNMPQYVENGGYVDGSKVQNAGAIYQCKPYPYSGWCNGAAWAYAPGTGSYWTDAWTLISSCTSQTVVPSSNTQTVFSPNPATDHITINTTETSKVTITSVQGNVVLTQTVPAQGTINISNLPAGLYSLRIETSTTIINTAFNKN